MSLPYQIFKKKGDHYIPGQFFRSFVRYKGNYYYEFLRVYADRTIAGKYILPNLPLDRLHKHISQFMKIGKASCKGMLGISDNEDMIAVPFEDVKKLIRANIVTLNYVGTVRLEIHEAPYTPLVDGYYTLDAEERIDSDDLICTFEDVFSKLNGKTTTVDIFLSFLYEFLHINSEKKESFRAKLKKLYLEIPSFQRSYIYPLPYGSENLTPIEDIIYKRKNRLDTYEEFIKVCSDDYFSKSSAN